MINKRLPHPHGPELSANLVAATTLRINWRPFVPPGEHVHSSAELETDLARTLCSQTRTRNAVWMMIEGPMQSPSISVVTALTLALEGRLHSQTAKFQTGREVVPASDECWLPVNPNPVIGKSQVRSKRSLLHVTRNAILFL
jgi:hypothetical protein